MIPLEVLKIIYERFSDVYCPIIYLVLNPAKDENYSVGDLIRDTIEEEEREDDE
jgi:hypothetical protein